MSAIRAFEITGVNWTQAPDRVEPGESFDLVVQVFGTADEETAGEPITFTIDGEPFITTTGADIPPGDFAFDGVIDVTIDEPGVYELRAEVAGEQSPAHIIGVGRDPDPDAVGGGGLSPALLGGLLVGGELLRRTLN